MNPQYFNNNQGLQHDPNQYVAVPVGGVANNNQMPPQMPNYYNSYQQQPKEKSTWWIWLIVVAVVGGIGTAIFLFLKNKIKLIPTKQEAKAEKEPEKTKEEVLEKANEILEKTITYPTEKIEPINFRDLKKKITPRQFIEAAHEIEGNIPTSVQTFIDYLQYNGYEKVDDLETPTYRNEAEGIDVEFCKKEIVISKDDYHTPHKIKLDKNQTFNEDFIEALIFGNDD